MFKFPLAGSKTISENGVWTWAQKVMLAQQEEEEGDRSPNSKS